MADSLSQPGDSPASDQQLTDRVLARVREAGAAEDRRARSSRPKRRRRHSDQPPAASIAEGGSPEQTREARALRRVFLDLGDSYRQYRRRTGAAISAEVREAAYRFRQERDLASLVSVAATLEELDAMT
jgi:hypothetical protein